MSYEYEKRKQQLKAERDFFKEETEIRQKDRFQYDFVKRTGVLVPTFEEWRLKIKGR